MKTKIIAVCAAFAAILVLSAAFFAVNGKEKNETAKAASGQTSAAAEEDSCFQLYRQYGDEHLRADDTVLFADLTHDGADEMIVLRVPSAGQWSDEPDENFLRVVTVQSGEVRTLYEDQIMVNRDAWFLARDGADCSIVHEVQAVWTGTGEITCDEFSLTEDGDMVPVEHLAQSFRFDDADPEQKLADYESRIAQRYGDDFSGVRLLASTQRAAVCDAASTAAEVFGVR